jgi:hypothetical protein
MTQRPRYVGLSLPRRIIREFMACAPTTNIVGGTRFINVAAVAAARRKQQPLIGWGAILLKAVALAAEQFPELRRSYMPLPWPHFYEHPTCVASIVIERDWRGERAVFADQIVAPEQKTLRELDMTLRALKQLPIEVVGGYRRQLRFARYPWPLRWLLLRFALYGSGRIRSRYIGTFMVNSIPVRRHYPTQSNTITAMSFFYGPIEPNGEMPIQLFFDHRVIDGFAVNRLFEATRAALHGEIIEELAESLPLPDHRAFEKSM